MLGEVFTVFTSVHSWPGWRVLYQVKCSQYLQAFIVGQVSLFRPGAVRGSVHLCGHTVALRQTVLAAPHRPPTLRTPALLRGATTLADGVHVTCGDN